MILNFFPCCQHPDVPAHLLARICLMQNFASSSEVLVANPGYTSGLPLVLSHTHMLFSVIIKHASTLLAASSELMSVFNSSLFISMVTDRRALFSFTSRLRLSRGVWRDEILSLDSANWRERMGDRNSK